MSAVGSDPRRTSGLGCTGVGKGRAVPAGTGWQQGCRDPLCPQGPLKGRGLPSSPDQKSESKLIMSLAAGRETANIGRRALVEGG